MKELIHKVRQLFMCTRVIENSAKYQILGFVCAGVHFIFMIMMAVGQVYLLAVVNVLATIFYAAGGLSLAYKERYKALFIGTLIEVEINSTIASILLGDGYEFMIYTLALIPGAFYLAHTWPAESKNKYGISMLPIYSTFVISVMYVLVDVMYSFISPVYTGEMITSLRPFFHYFNIMISVFFLFSFSVLFALEVRYFQKLLSEENSRLGEIASKDPLTKALNRRSFNNILNDNFDNKESAPFGLIILDIDDFKKVNDTYGHNAGDQVLIRLSSIIHDTLGENDSCCRWGGEEFLVLIHGQKEEYISVAERIRIEMAKQKFSAEKGDFKVTVTLGIAEYQIGLKARTLIEMADQKLYYGKTHGKNQVVK